MAIMAIICHCASVRACRSVCKWARVRTNLSPQVWVCCAGHHRKYKYKHATRAVNLTTKSYYLSGELHIIVFLCIKLRDPEQGILILVLLCHNWLIVGEPWHWCFFQSDAYILDNESYFRRVYCSESFIVMFKSMFSCHVNGLQKMA